MEVGHGRGRNVSFFHKKGINVIGIDYSRGETNNAKSTYAGLKFEQQDIENLDFEDNSVGAFFVINVIHYVDENKALKEIWRTVKSKGYAFIHFNISITDASGNIDLEQSEKEIINLVKDFTILEKRTIERLDSEPVEHKHKILELILQKK